MSEFATQDGFVHHRSNAQVITISSGKGGVGKTLTICHFALSLALSGKRVLIIDGDMGMSNVDVVLGLHARYNINDVISGRIRSRDIVLNGPCGVDVVSSGSGLFELTHLSYVQKEIVKEVFSELSDEYDVILIDTGAGVGDNVCYMNGLSQTNILVTTPEPHALTDAYAALKILHNECHLNRFGVVVNMTSKQGEGSDVGARLARVADDYLKVKVAYLGEVPVDASVVRAVRRRQSISTQSLNTRSGQAWNAIAASMLEFGSDCELDTPLDRQERAPSGESIRSAL